jgi:hypothetical protein
MPLTTALQRVPALHAAAARMGRLL